MSDGGIVIGMRVGSDLEAMGDVTYPDSLTRCPPMPDVSRKAEGDARPIVRKKGKLGEMMGHLELNDIS